MAFLLVFALILVDCISRQVSSFEMLSPPSTCLRKTIVLVGPSGVGKSTVGNCFINRLGWLNTTQEYPFPTNNSANGCTRNSSLACNDDLCVIDTLGFGDPQADSRYSFELFQQALTEVNNRVDLVLFVFKQDRLKDELFAFFRIFQDKVFAGKMRHNSAVICSQCRAGWLAENRRENLQLDQLLRSCNERAFEFKLPFDLPQMDNSPIMRDELEKINEKSRQHAIDRLLVDINHLSTHISKVNLQHVQDEQFKKLFAAKYQLEMEKLNSIISGMVLAKDMATTGLRRISQFVQNNLQVLIYGAAALQFTLSILQQHDRELAPGLNARNGIYFSANFG